MTENQSTHVIEWDVNTEAIAEVAEQFKEVDAYRDLDEAKAAKKVLVKMRSALTAAHKDTKAEALAFGRKVDAKKNEYLKLITDIEDPISDQLDEIKNAERIKEEERVQKIMNYIEGIQAFALDRHSLTLEELIARRDELHSRGLDPEVTQEHHEDAQLSYDEADLKLRLAIDAEEQRLKDEEARAAQEEENRKLKEKIDKMEAEQAERDAEDAKKRAEEAAEAQRKADIKAELERKAREKAEDEARELREADEARRAEEERKNAEAEAEARAAEQAPDRVKLLAYADSVDELLKAKPTLATDIASEVLLNASAMLIEVAYDIRKMTEEMK